MPAPFPHCHLAADGPLATRRKLFNVLISATTEAALRDCIIPAG